MRKISVGMDMDLHNANERFYRQKAESFLADFLCILRQFFYRMPYPVAQIFHPTVNTSNAFVSHFEAFT